MNIKKLTLPLVMAIVAGCGGPSGSGFEGKWTQNTGSKPSSLLIKKDGEIYHVDFTYNNPQLDAYKTKKLEASAASDNVLTIVGAMGAINMRLQDGNIYFKDSEYVKQN
jgi:hypothetical protein